MTATCFQTTVHDPRWNFAFMGDYTAYPQDVWEYLVEFCVLWNFSAPTFSRKSKEGSRAVMWLNALREMQEVCAEFGLEAVREYRRYFEGYMETHNGLAPIRVDSPKSLLNELAGHVAIMRSKPKEKQKYTSLSDWGIETEETEECLCLWRDVLREWEDEFTHRKRIEYGPLCNKPVAREFGKYCEEHERMKENDPS